MKVLGATAIDMFDPAGAVVVNRFAVKLNYKGPSHEVQSARIGSAVG